MQFVDNVAIVTGGAGAIGQAVAIRLAQEGAAVVVADLNLAGAEQVAAALVDAGATACALELDVCSRDSIKAMVATVMQAFGRIDVLVNNAGGSARLVQGAYCLIHEAEEKVIDSMIDINAKQPSAATKRPAPYRRCALRGGLHPLGLLCVGVLRTRDIQDCRAPMHRPGSRKTQDCETPVWKRARVWSTCV